MLSFFLNRTLVEACNEGDIGKVQKLLNEGRVSVHDTTEEGESLLSLACSAGYFELAQVNTVFWLTVIVLIAIFQFGLGL